MMKQTPKINRILSLMLASFIILLASVPVTACAAGNEPKTVRAGFFAFDGYHEIDDEGIKSGYGYDFLRLAERYANVNFEYVGYDKSWDDMQQMLLNGEIDMVTSAHKTDVRQKLYDFSLPIGTNTMNLNTRASEERFVPENYHSYNGMVLGLLSGSSSNSKVEDFAQEKGFDFIAKYYPDDTALEDALQSGEVDAVATSSLRKIRNEKTLSEFNTENFYCIVRKGDTELLNTINYAIEQMNNNEGNWQSTFYYNNYTAENNAEIVFTDIEKEYIARHSNGEDKLVISIDQNWVPFTWMENGEYVGILPDYIKIVMDICGMDYRMYTTDKTICDESVLENPEVDVYFAYTLAENDMENDGLISSSSMFDLGSAYLLMKGTTQVKSVAITASTPYLNTRIEVDPDVKVKEYPSAEAIVEAVLNGEVDAAFLYDYYAEYIVNHDKTGRLAYELYEMESIPLMAVMRSGDDRTLMSILMKCINHVPDTEKTAIVSKYTSYSVFNLTLKEYMALHPMTMLVAGVILAALITAILFTLMRSRIMNRHNEEMKAAKDEAEAANQAKTRFLNSMSHDIRTPMNAIIGYTAMAKKHTINPKVDDYLSKIDLSGKQLLSLVNQVLEMSRIESGKVTLSQEPVNLIKLAKELETVVASDMDAKGISYSLNTDKIEHADVLTDASRINQIVVNIVGNAVKYTPEGGHIDCTIEERSCEKEGCGLYVTRITDTGIGMSEEYLSHIFEEFTREKTSTVSNIQGTGLGMSIVKKLIDLMDATIDVQSKVGEGTAVTISVPMKWNTSSGNADADNRNLGGKSLEGMRILLVEDNEMNREIATEILVDEGAAVDTAEDGDIAVDMVRKALESGNSGYYDAVLMDIQMPRMDGYEATKAIRALPSIVPIIALSANAFEEDRLKSLEAGMDEHVAKPIDIPKLKATLAKYI